MSATLYLPSDEPDPDLAADYLELKAVFSEEKQSFSQDIIDALALAADSEFADVDAEMENREEVADGAIARMASRKRMLVATYPFELDERGDVISFVVEEPDLGQTAYLLSLLLSNLRAVSPMLDGSEMHPSDQDERALRQWFQYFATAALAAEIGGQAWSFGFPRPGGTGFIGKFTEIWDMLKDGSVEAHASAPRNPMDDGIEENPARQAAPRPSQCAPPAPSVTLRTVRTDGRVAPGRPSKPPRRPRTRARCLRSGASSRAWKVPH